MIEIKDPDEIKRLSDKASGKIYATDNTEDQGYGFGEGGVSGALSAAGKGLASSLMSIAGATASNPDTSRYASRYAAKYAQQAAEKEQTLGTAGKFVAGAGKYAPAIAAGIVNPYAGAGVSGLLTTGDVLGTQYAETGEYNLPKAAAAGTLAGAADIASMGLASKLPVKGLASRIGANAVEDAGSAVGQQAATNWGEDKDVTSNLGEAALTGAVGGMAVRGAAKTGEKVLNKAGITASDDLSSVFKDTVNPDHAASYVDYHNAQQDYFDAMKSGDVDKAVAAAEAINEKTLNEGSTAAAMTAFKDLQENGFGLTDRALGIDFGSKFDRKGNVINYGRDVMGASDKQMAKAGDIGEKAGPSLTGTVEAQKKGLTSESHKLNVQDKMRTYFSNKERVLTDNADYVRNQVEYLKDNGAEPALIKKYSDLAKDLSIIEKDGISYIRDNKTPVEALTGAAKRATRLAAELKEIGNLKGFDEQYGTWNPLQDIRTTELAHKFVLKEVPTVYHGIFDPTKERVTKGLLKPDLTDISLSATGNFWAVPLKKVAGLGIRSVKGSLSQKALAKQKTITQERAKQIAELQGKVKQSTPTKETTPPTPTKEDVSIEKSLQEGDSFKATEQAAADLEKQGIGVPGERDQNAVQSVTEASTKPRSKLGPETPAPVVKDQQAPIVEVTIPKKRTDSKFVKPAVKPVKVEEPVNNEPIKTETIVEPTPTTEVPATKKERSKIPTKEPVQSTKTDSTITEPVNVEPVKEEITTPKKKKGERVPTKGPVQPVKVEEPKVIVEETAPKKKKKGTVEVKQPTKPTKVEEPTKVENSVEDVKIVPKKRGNNQFVRPAVKPTKKVEEIKADEPVNAEPTKEEVSTETTPEKVLGRSTSNSYELVRKPLASKVEELQNAPVESDSVSHNMLVHKTQEDLKFFETIVRQISRETKTNEDYVADVIREMGDISDIRGNFGSEAKAEIKAKVHEKLKSDKDQLAAEEKAKQDAKLAEDKAKTEVIEEKADKIIEDAKTKAKKDKEDKLIEEFRKTYINKSVHHSTVDAAIKKGRLSDGSFSAKAAKAAIDTAIKDAAKKVANSAPKPMTHAEAKSLIDDFVGDNYSIKSVKSAVDDVFRNVTGKDPAPSISALRSLQNRVLKLIQAEADKADKLAKAESDAYDAWVANADKRLQAELDAKSEELGKKISSAEKALKKAREEAAAEQKRYDEYWEKGNTANPVEVTKAKMQLRSKQSTVETISETIENLGKDRKKLDEILSKPRTTDPVEEAFYKARIAKATKASKEFREVEKKMQQKLKSQEKETSEKAKILDQITETNKLTQNILSTPEVKIQEQVENLQTISKDFEEATLKALENSPKGTEEALASKINDLSKMEQGSSSESLARVAGIMKAVAKRSEDPLVQKSMNKFSEILAKSAEMKKKYPNNPETWISRDDYDTLKEIKFGDKLSSYAGSIGTNLTIGIYGSKHRPDTLLSSEKIGQISRALDTGIKKGIMSSSLKEAVKGKGGVRKIATGDKDIKVVVRKIKK